MFMYMYMYMHMDVSYGCEQTSKTKNMKNLSIAHRMYVHCRQKRAVERNLLPQKKKGETGTVKQDRQAIAIRCKLLTMMEHSIPGPILQAFAHTCTLGTKP